MIFRQDNTEGFSADDICELNIAAEHLMTEAGLDGKDAANALTNAYFKGATADELVQRVANFGMISA